MGSDILVNIAYAEDDEILLADSIDFAGDSLMCEFAYVIDFDKNVFEIYCGFNKDDLESSERFALIEPDHDEYKQVKLKHSFSLSSLPSKEEFLTTLEPDCEE